MISRVFALSSLTLICMGNERASTTRHREAGKICCSYRRQLPYQPTNFEEQPKVNAKHADALPRAGFTTKDLVRKNEALVPVLLPHLAGRPLNLTRYLDDGEGEAFWEKDAPSFTPKWERLRHAKYIGLRCCERCVTGSATRARRRNRWSTCLVDEVCRRQLRENWTYRFRSFRRSRIQVAQAIQKFEVRRTPKGAGEPNMVPIILFLPSKVGTAWLCLLLSIHNG